MQDYARVNWMPICPSCRDESSHLGAPCPRCLGSHYILDDAVEDAKSDPRIGGISADKYVVLGLINEGGMGAVYRALQLPVEREVALKVLRAELTDSDQAGERFIREARAVSKLNHPNIITLFDFGFDSNRHPYMVMEYAPGDSLATWVRKPDLTMGRIAHVTHQILSALTEAHQTGIVHRDLKPGNMIVSSAKKRDMIKLLDFGIARLINENATRSLTREGEVFGTPHYMAPEQGQGKKNVGPSADIYAVGIMLYEMIVGETPFDAPTPLAVLFMHINEPLPEVVPREGVVVPEDILDILEKATHKVPEERFQDAEEMMFALEDVLGTSPSALADITGELQLAALGIKASVATDPAIVKSPVVAGPNEKTQPPLQVHSESVIDFHTQKTSPKKKIMGLLFLLMWVIMLSGGALVFYFSNRNSVDMMPEAKEFTEKLDRRGKEEVPTSNTPSIVKEKDPQQNSKNRTGNLANKQDSS